MLKYNTNNNNHIKFNEETRIRGNHYTAMDIQILIIILTELRKCEPKVLKYKRMQ